MYKISRGYFGPCVWHGAISGGETRRPKIPLFTEREFQCLLVPSVLLCYGSPIRIGEPPSDRPVQRGGQADNRQVPTHLR
jgi:hypothetical protein